MYPSPPTSGPTGPPSGGSLSATTFTSGVTSNSTINGLANGPDGRIWFAQTNTAQVGAVTTSGIVSEYTVTAPAGYSCVVPENVVSGPDGNVYVSSFCGELIQITPAGVVRVFGINPSSVFAAIVVGPDKNLWLGDEANGLLLVVNTHGSVLATYALPSGAVPTALTVGGDGNVWVADDGLAAIHRVTTAGAITSFSTGLPSGQTVLGITAAPDGNLYFTAPPQATTSTAQVGRVTTSGAITMLGLLGSTAAPYNLTTDTNGNVWFRDDTTGQNAVGRIVTSTASVTEYTLSGITSPNVPDDGGGNVTGGIVYGPDSNLWLGGNGAIYKVVP
jgi:streptogramin lyase